MNNITFKIATSTENTRGTRFLANSAKIVSFSNSIYLNKNLLPKFTVADKILYHPLLKPIRHKIFDITGSDYYCKLRENAAFTLAETMIVLVILGVVAAITVPALVNRHMEAERRTKLRKAMSVYDTALNKMVIENGIKSDTALTNWADSDTKNDCANTSAYFKISRNLEIDGNTTNCKFRAPDGVFWDISDIKKPLVALREQDLNDETAQSDTNRAFYMFGWFDEQGSLRSNDMGKINVTDKADLEKLYDFIAGKTKTTMNELNNDSNKTDNYTKPSDYSDLSLTDKADFLKSANLKECEGEVYANAVGTVSNCYWCYDNECSTRYIYDDKSNVFTYYCSSNNCELGAYNSPEYDCYSDMDGFSCNGVYNDLVLNMLSSDKFNNYNIGNYVDTTYSTFKGNFYLTNNGEQKEIKLYETDMHELICADENLIQVSCEGKFKDK